MFDSFQTYIYVVLSLLTFYELFMEKENCKSNTPSVGKLYVYIELFVLRSVQLCSIDSYLSMKLNNFNAQTIIFSVERLPIGKRRP